METSTPMQNDVAERSAIKGIARGTEWLEVPQKVFIPSLGVPISLCTMGELMRFVRSAQNLEQKVLVDNVNMDILWHARHNLPYRQVLTHRSHVTLVDGVPVCWLAGLAGVSVPQRLALTDVVPALLRLATEQEYSVFVLGSSPQTLARAKANLRRWDSMPHTMACWSEPREKLENPQTNADVLGHMRQIKPDIVFVALGSPWQSLWIERNWDDLPDSVIIPVGGAFDFIAGQVGRAPGWMQTLGLEWTYRLLFDHQHRDRSLFERYILTDLPFALQMAMAILQRRWGGLAGYYPGEGIT